MRATARGGGVRTTAAVVADGVLDGSAVGAGQALNGSITLPGTQVHSQAFGKSRAGPRAGWQQTGMPVLGHWH